MTVQARGIIYLASMFDACVAEFFQNTGTINRKRRQPWLVGFETLRSINLLDLKGLWPTVAGASMAINNSSRRDITRAWSRVIYDAYPWAHGLWYGSSMHMNTSSVALYERGLPAIPSTYSVHFALADDYLLADLERIRRSINYNLI